MMYIAEVGVSRIGNDVAELGPRAFGVGMAKAKPSRPPKDGGHLRSRYSMGGKQSLYNLWRYVDRRGEGECWPWIGRSKKPDGRATVRWAGKGVNSSRAIWAAYNGVTPPPHLHVCHTCNNAPCCNPKHLYLATHAENIRYAVACGRVVPPKFRSVGKRPLEKLTTHCIKGHERTPENNYIRPKDGVRVCKVCRASYGRSYRKRLSETRHA